MGEDLVSIEPRNLTIDKIAEVTEQRKKIVLSETSLKRVMKCREYLDNRLRDSDQAIYGVNTGFGSLCNTAISKKDLEKLQYNLVVSHACGMGPEIPKDIVELMILLKIQGLAAGHSAIDPSTILRLVDFYNYEISPVVYEHGSLGASGDLAPLAHLSLPLIGKGEVYFNGKRIGGHQLDELFNWKPLKLKAKEGLALLNGTQFMSAYAVHLLIKLKKLMKLGDLIASISFDAFHCTKDFLNPLIHDLRPHAGQITTAANMLRHLEKSEIAKSPSNTIQDPYSFRCIPQVHGASKDAINKIEEVVQTEINSVTDNPTVFPEEDEILSAGNFHGQALAINLDYMAIAVSELSSISERRVFKLISGQRDLPSYLTPHPGLNSGFMIPQYTAASIASQNKHLCHPASVDSIDSSNGQEDHVSMGANSATKAYKVVENYEKVLSIELFTACQALEFRKPLKSSPEIMAFMKKFRKEVPFIERDVEMYKLMEKSLEFVKEY